MSRKAGDNPEKKAPDESAKALLQSAADILKKTQAEVLMIYADSLPTLDLLAGLGKEVPIVLVTDEHLAKTGSIAGVRASIPVPAFKLTRMDRIKLATIVGLARGVLKAGQKVVCVTGVADSGSADTIMLLEIGTEYEIFRHSAGKFPSSDLSAEVLVRTIDIAAKLSLEGREGKAIGTCFVLGDADKVISLTRQMTMNPFKGYAEEERNILAPELEETIKEFASIDGAFVVQGDGVILTAGAYLQPPSGVEAVEPGLGARHVAAAAITEATSALAVVLSESTGAIRLYRKGVVVMAIERPKGGE
jgi:DNA integrity scanning protein DisA with diadenylate cyclase activity